MVLSTTQTRDRSSTSNPTSPTTNKLTLFKKMTEGMKSLCISNKPMTKHAKQFLTSDDDTVMLDKSKYPYNLLDNSLYQEDVIEDPRDKNTPDNWVKRHPEMVRLTGIHPFNSEVPINRLMGAGFLTPTSVHYTRNHGPVPKLSWRTHKLHIIADDEGVALGFKNHTLSMDDIAAMPSITVPVTLCCAGNRRKEVNLHERSIGFSWNTGATSTACWTGVRLRDILLKLCKVHWPSEEEGYDYDAFDLEDRYLWMVGADELPNGNYGSCIPLGEVMNVANDIIIAYKCNGALLPPDRGFPLRMIVPGWIGGRMVKWLTRLEIRKGESQNHYHYFDNRILPPNVTKEIADAEGWWMKPEYLFNELNINSVITAPFHNDTLTLQPEGQTRDKQVVELSGYAYSGGGKRITRVEISFDYGATWQLCDLKITERPNRYCKFWCWTHWSFKATAAQVSDKHRLIQCRAWDQTNNTQPNNFTWNLMGMGNNFTFSVRVDHSIRDSDGATVLKFVHPTQEAGMADVGWMSKQHKQPARAPPIKMLLKDGAPQEEEVEVAAALLEEDNSDLEGLSIFSMGEVAKHTTKESAWIVVHNRVYDCTSFLSEHPGGDSSILMSAGTDCTQEFEDIHSTKAHKMMKTYLIGGVEGATVSKSDETTISKDFLSASGVRKDQSVALESVTQLSRNSQLLRFSLSHAKQVFGLPPGKHIMIKCPNPNPDATRLWNGKEDPDEGESTVERKYTPSSSDFDLGYFELVIKVYPGGVHENFPDGGKMSQYLGSLSIGDRITVCGPWGINEYKAPGLFARGRKEYNVKHIGMIAGGTGITPMLQLIDRVLSNPEDNTKLWLLFANQTEEDILVRGRLEERKQKHPERFHLHYTVSHSAGENWTYSRGRVDEHMLREHMPKAGSDSIVLMCGPPQMIKYACRANLDKLGFAEEMQIEF